VLLEVILPVRSIHERVTNYETRNPDSRSLYRLRRRRCSYAFFLRYQDVRQPPVRYLRLPCSGVRPWLADLPSKQLAVGRNDTKVLLKK
jgi:hypothetical protein